MVLFFVKRSDNRYYLSNFCSLPSEDISEYKSQYLNKVYHIVLNIAGSLLEHNLNNRELCIKLTQQRLEQKYILCARFRRQIEDITAFMYDEGVEIHTTKKYRKIHHSYIGIFDYLYEKLLDEYDNNYLYKVFPNNKPVIKYRDISLYTQEASEEIGKKYNTYKIYSSLCSLRDVSETIANFMLKYQNAKHEIEKGESTIDDYLGDYAYYAHQILDIPT